MSGLQPGNYIREMFKIMKSFALLHAVVVWNSHITCIIIIGIITEAIYNFGKVDIQNNSYVYEIGKFLLLYVSFNFYVII
jgi:hypothetical protein